MSPSTSGHVDYDRISNKGRQSPRPLQGAELPAAWGIGWRCPTLMVGLVTCGAMLSVGHHFYYRSFDQTLVDSRNQQAWAIRIGTGFAFLVKSCLVSAVGVAAVQETWATLRRKSVKLSGIDSMFAVLDSPLAFFTPDLWLYAKTLTALAIISWLIPLTAIITPSTLYVVAMQARQTSRLGVPSVSFADSFWSGEAALEGAGRINAPSPNLSRLFTVTASSMQVLPVPAPFPNSSYLLEFWGPSYKCQSLSEALLNVHGLSQGLWDRQNPLWNNNASQPTELVCQLWNTSYMVSLTFNDGIQTLTPISVDHIAYSNWSSEAGTYSLLQNSDPTVNGGFYVVHMLFSGLIQGNLRTGVSGSVRENITSQTAFTKLSIAQTGLFACPEMWNGSNSDYLYGNSLMTSCRNRTLARAIEDLSHNLTYNLLSLNAANTTVDVLDLTSRNFYIYDQEYLILAYMTALGVTVACIIIGFFALRRNGVSQRTSFSSVLMTTRNPDLDRLAVGHCLGAEPLEKEIGKVLLQYGEIESPGQRHKHAAFGTKGSVVALSKGEDYY
ncbi:hypothetical protein AN3244.2 [Aspergillus nidulans FGSC A4]|uniref:Formylmethionine deformylase-like protein n=1 Tax=Emericella nidulans (strain FGSC A4 / ATCC 38163 / CBS 112.46 / NRRL 194 / M139) TaxID=227321 RepID=Q5B886_EMENI|nr:hypothetical protein [Aspergillus nidulans FGSC A4]EAA63145.1 hypothetical protein AN3244.2 [Aspergillus nidulans FGSC A4]CBF83110.1 TPA: conserved hypothetical protein [Aspergillus nidulans FGSC A4]|eukprot:XP_660848.1 hypothetical protein AN3244.2 [Aspergillus nidulans FGSC A4]